jgi:rRNA processing protein Krr1/Pno1
MRILNELYVYQSLFSHRGYQAEVLDLRDLLYEDGKLISKYTHRTIDVVYRRAVTRDIMEHYDEIQSFIQAVKDDHVCLIGAFQTQLIHHKEISKVLVKPSHAEIFH